MKAIYNSRVLPLETIGLEIHNRAFCYGDGLFETIVTGAERINLTHYHMARLTRASALLHIQIAFDEQLLEKMMEELKKENKIKGDCRFRLQVWRNAGGLYEPKESDSSFLLTCQPTDYFFFDSLEYLGMSQNTKVVHHQLSFAKSMSALPYVVAGLERKQSGFDDLIITNEKGMMAECIASNLFWVEEGKFYTPALSTGCIAGTMRAYLIEKMATDGNDVLEVEVSLEVLKTAEAIFLTNAAGIRWVGHFEGHTFNNPYLLLKPYI